MGEEGDADIDPWTCEGSQARYKAFTALITNAGQRWQDDITIQVEGTHRLIVQEGAEGNQY